MQPDIILLYDTTFRPDNWVQSFMLSWTGLVLSFCRSVVLSPVMFETIPPPFYQQSSHVKTIGGEYNSTLRAVGKGRQIKWVLPTLITSGRFRFDMRFWFHTNYDPWHIWISGRHFHFADAQVAQKHLQTYCKMLIRWATSSFSYFHFYFYDTLSVSVHMHQH